MNEELSPSGTEKQSVHGERLNQGAGRWLVATFKPVSLFSLRMTHATSKGGKTLVVPTPYAVKMALLDACFRRYPPAEALRGARAAFDTVKGRDVRIEPPAQCVVQNTFVKVLDASRDGPDPFKETIAYREFVYYQGQMRIALAVAGLPDEVVADLRQLFAHINYIGKRGGFWQFLSAEIMDDLPVGFTVPLDGPVLRGVPEYGMVQALDDFGEALCGAQDGFQRLSTYGDGTMRLGEHRVLKATAIPYVRRAASRNFTWYSRPSRA